MIDMTTKEEIRFAIIPKIIEGKIIWLKHYISVYEYKFTRNVEYITYGFLLEKQQEMETWGYKWILKYNKLK